MYRVLIADDEVCIVEGLQNTLDWEAHGCAVVATAFDGIQAYEKAKECRPDIVITDIGMPKMDGLALVEALNHAAWQMEFIVLTCHQDFALAHTALRNGVCDYIIKETMTRAELCQSLEKAKHRLCQRRELASKNVWEEDPVIAKILTYLQEHLAERLTLAQVAGIAAMNTSYFSRYFKNKLDENFVDYLARIRMQVAMDQLINTTCSMDQIAERCGYANLSYFHAAFKKATGTSPALYRKEHRRQER